ncbi:helix-turn-helix domain-containing protein [Paenibacillus lautus]|uniref:helix-turn-helix domain-containing protein n=1 Tax=Paenibacillus lautus TaxID=1401 RepID=UPI003D26628D
MHKVYALFGGTVITIRLKGLNIHRNTLNYRLNRIKQLTGKNSRHVLDLFELLCGLMWRK